MSYYFYSKYKFSHHALMRAKQRLNLSVSLDDLLIKSHCLKLINESNNRWEDNSNIYVQVNDTDLHFVVDKYSLLIKTITKMDVAKQLKICEGNN